jgi:hypothetical protein
MPKATPPEIAMSKQPLATRAKSDLPTLGWREWLALPELGLAAVRAKVDTGARSSALHVEQADLFDQDGIEMVRFTLDTGRASLPLQTVTARVHDRRRVIDSGGHATERIFICTSVRMADRDWPIEINLTDRKNLLFPMLLGRSAIRGRFRVNPARSFLLGREAPEATP